MLFGLTLSQVYQVDNNYEYVFKDLSSSQLCVWETLNGCMIAFDGDVVPPTDWSPDSEFVLPVSDDNSLDYELSLSKSVKECFIECKDDALEIGYLDCINDEKYVNVLNTFEKKFFQQFYFSKPIGFIYLLSFLVLFEFLSKQTLTRQSSIVMNKKTTQSISTFQSIIIIMFILTSLVDFSSASSCGLNSDCSIFLQTCSTNLCTCSVGSTWQNKQALPTGRCWHATVADDQTNIYVFGGQLPGNILTNTTYKYTSSNNVWSQLQNIPNILYQIDGVFINGKIYIPGDVNNPRLYVYTISTNTWQTFTNKQVDGTTNLIGRYGYQVQNIGTKIYLMGGIINGIGISNQVWVLDITTDLNSSLLIATWTPLTSMNASRYQFGSAVIVGKIYVAGGLSNNPALTRTVEVFDPTLNQWTFEDQIPSSDWSWMASSSGSAPNGKPVMWLVAGFYGGSYSGLTGYFDPSAASGQKWVISGLPSLSQRVWLSGALSSDGYFYVPGGLPNFGSPIANNQRLFVCLPPVDACWNVVCPSGETCVSGVCKCGSASSCSSSGQVCCNGQCKSLTEVDTCGSCSNDCTIRGFDLCCSGQCGCGSCNTICQSNQACSPTLGCLNCGYVTLPTSPINEGSPVSFVFNAIQTNQYYSAYIRAIINGKTITNSTVFTGSQTSLSLTFGGPGTATITYALASEGSSPCSETETTTIQVNDVLPQVSLNIPSKISTGQSFKANGTASEVGFWTRPSVILSINGVISTVICTVTPQSSLSTNTQYSYSCASIHMSSAGSYTIRAIANVSWGNQNLLSNYSQRTLTVGNNF